MNPTAFFLAKNSDLDTDPPPWADSELIVCSENFDVARARQLNPKAEYYCYVYALGVHKSRKGLSEQLRAVDAIGADHAAGPGIVPQDDAGYLLWDLDRLYLLARVAEIVSDWVAEKNFHGVYLDNYFGEFPPRYRNFYGITDDADWELLQIQWIHARSFLVQYLKHLGVEYVIANVGRRPECVTLDRHDGLNGICVEKQHVVGAIRLSAIANALSEFRDRLRCIAWGWESHYARTGIIHERS